jgi:MinD superfamily P-loop ATPase
MKELVVISGKGGTGKTSLVGALASFAGRSVLADCDVDAADLHLLLAPKILARHDFTGGWKAAIDPDICTGCGECRVLCRFEAISLAWEVDPFRCEGCGVCHDHCPEKAVVLAREKAGEWFESETRLGPLVHARLGIGGENSGKLVALIRTRAREIARETGAGFILVDGSPGIGCPVISSVTGADLVLVVTEPSPSGLHDLRRVLELAAHFRVPVAVCIYKCDIHPGLADRIEDETLARGAIYAGRIPFDPAVTAAMVLARTLPELGDGPAVRAARGIWTGLKHLLAERNEESHAHL